MYTYAGLRDEGKSYTLLEMAPDIAKFSIELCIFTCFISCACTCILHNFSRKVTILCIFLHICVYTCTCIHIYMINQLTTTPLAANSNISHRPIDVKNESHPVYMYTSNLICFPHAQSLVASGLGSGLTEGVIIAPFERVKVYMQAQRSKMSEVSIYRLMSH